MSSAGLTCSTRVSEEEGVADSTGLKTSTAPARSASLSLRRMAVSGHTNCIPTKQVLHKRSSYSLQFITLLMSHVAAEVAGV
jgi:hypothetical protein